MLAALRQVEAGVAGLLGPAAAQELHGNALAWQPPVPVAWRCPSRGGVRPRRGRPSRNAAWSCRRCRCSSSACTTMSLRRCRVPPLLWG
jgi:hypothetical protein